MRPKKTRCVEREPGERCFRPKCKPLSEVENVYMTLDEFEALRLSDLKGFEQDKAAKRLKISRPTFSRILSSARRKVSDGLVNIKAICIEGGCCAVGRGSRK